MEVQQTDRPPTLPLTKLSKLLVRQVHEFGEWLGYETRNKYEILDENKRPIGYAAEQQKGILGFLLRQFLGHWRSFEFHLFDQNRQKILTARQPFRLWFQRLDVFDASGNAVGAIQLRFAIFTKRFDVLDATGQIVMRVASPIFRLWTFPFISRGREVACIRKKWSGILLEALTDKDTFLVEYADSELSQSERELVLCAALFVDLRYFETKAD